MAQATKQASGYLPPADGPFQCAHCQHFHAPGSCELVAGAIAPMGCCNLYASVTQKTLGQHLQESREAY